MSPSSHPPQGSYSAGDPTGPPYRTTTIRGPSGIRNSICAPLEALTLAVANGWRIATPATRTGSRYAWLPEAAIRELPSGGVMMPGILSSLQRPKGDLTLSRVELAASSG